jgi:hypothetical protein
MAGWDGNSATFAKKWDQSERKDTYDMDDRLTQEIWYDSYSH